MAASTVSGKGPLYTLGFNNQNVYSVDLQNNTSSLVAKITSSSSPESIVLINPQSAYMVDLSPNIFQIDLLTGNYSIIARGATGTETAEIAILDANTALFVNQNAGNGNIYSLNRQTGDIQLFTTVHGAVDLEGIAIVNSEKALVSDFTNNQVYSVNLKTGTSQLLATFGNQLLGITLANTNEAYVTSYNDSKVYLLNLSTGNVSLITPNSIGATGGGIGIITLSNSTVGYAANYTDSNVYSIDLTSGNATNLLHISGAGLSGTAFYLQMLTTGLSGNNLKLAQYLNNNAPVYVIRSFALQATELPQALESAAPTRNAFFTFASQTTQLAFGQQLYDHFAQKRWQRAWAHPSLQSQQTMAAQGLLKHELFVDSSDPLSPEALPVSVPFSPQTPPESEQPSPPSPYPDMLGKERAYYSPWLGIFGEYTHESAQSQTPAFETGTGGFVLAMDYHRGVIPKPLLGGGIAYAYTHVHESDGMGHANINQGAAVVYGEMTFKQWYTNWALWGGYYHAHNVRNISISGVAGSSATANAHGWQFAPHLEVGYDYEKDWFCIEPFEMIDWVACWEDGFQEQGAGQLNMGQNSRFCSLLRNEAGIRFNETLCYCWGTVTFQQKGSYVYQKAFHTGKITAFLVGSSGSFVVSTLTGAQNLGVIEFESLFVPKNRKYPYGTVSSQVELGTRYQSYQGMVTIEMDF